jgi:hypothetical protein
MSSQNAQMMEALRLYRKALTEFKGRFVKAISGSLEVTLLAHHADRQYEALVGAGVDQSDANQLVKSAILQAITQSRKSLPFKKAKKKARK